ncbi:sterile alpha motif domain-containing protein 12-like isoform X1 [Fundulus heteroclitus]|uniref:sterile alpha motif domain-containing protein 12-like isoform X1 n=1 Tax=Fundulus heteroclitus TaxID=8078 RepID=UPI00165B985A|nr:sterile alpha motif domain-containing protein 12-like isoform X1 [Fundulus heteroclitus]
MSQSQQTSSWSVEEVLEWIQEQHPEHIESLYKGIMKHDISGRALLRLKEHHLKLLGVEDNEQQQEILQDLLLLRVQEEINELNDICSGWQNDRRIPSRVFLFPVYPFICAKEIERIDGNNKRR